MYNVKTPILLLAMLLPVMLYAGEKQTTYNDALAVFYTIDKNAQKTNTAILMSKLQSIGFNLTETYQHPKMQNKIGHNKYPLLSLIKYSSILPLLNVEPRLAGFSHIHLSIDTADTANDTSKTRLQYLMPKTMLDILGIKDNDVREQFTAPFKAFNATIGYSIGAVKTYRTNKQSLPHSMINFQHTFKSLKDIKTFKDRFELALLNDEYTITSYSNFMNATQDAKKILSKYSDFWAYSITKQNQSSKENNSPILSNIYMYIKKETQTLTIGIPSLQNFTHIIDTSKHVQVQKQENGIASILKKLGMKDLSQLNLLQTTPTHEPVALKKQIIKKSPNNNRVKSKKTSHLTPKIHLPSIPIVPSVPKAIQFKKNANDRSIKFSKRVPPNYVPHNFDQRQKTKKSVSTQIGQPSAGRISAYLRGKFITVNEAENKLKAAGFKHISTTPLNKRKDLISVVFTHETLLAMASKENRGFMATLRLLVDTKEKTISITNPLYLAKAFMQKDFDEKPAKKILNSLISQFPHLKNSEDSLKFQLLPQYQFMNGMPKYNNMIEVASGSDLIQRVQGNKRLVFTQKLHNGSILLGIELRKRTKKFTKKIGRNNAAMLPYPILIENGNAKILDPKYYISLMYPMLKMSEFMTIATIPDAMVKDCEKMFKK